MLLALWVFVVVVVVVGGGVVVLVVFLFVDAVSSCSLCLWLYQLWFCCYC